MSKEITVHSSRGQGGLEYLLLIGGAVLIATMVLILLVTSVVPDGQFIVNDSISDYQGQVSLNQAFSGGSGGDGGPVSTCGNGITEEGEACDSGIMDCSTSGYPGTQSCLMDCSGFDVCNSPLYCGDGLCNGTESPFTCTDCTDTNPPVPSLSLADGDKLVVASFSAIDPEGNPTLTYTLLYSTNQTKMDGVLLSGPTNSFDSPPIGVYVVSPPLAIPGANVYSPFDGKLSLGGIPNGVPTYFRVRACDSGGNCAATFPSMTVTPAHKTVNVTVGADEIVFDWSAKKCTNLDIPDNPARFFRTSSGLTMIAGNAPNVYVSKSADFSAANLLNGHMCPPAAPVSLASTNNIEAYTFDNYEWIWSTYIEGSTVHAIVHNEFHDTHAYASPPCKAGDPTPSNKCWYNTLTLATSTNDGTTFTQASSPTDKLIAAGPNPWDYTAITASFPLASYEFYGYQGGTNIIKRGDGYYYSIFYRELNPNGATSADAGYCIMRTNNLSDNTSWRAWDGKEYATTMFAPYSGSTPAPTGKSPCAFISFTNQFYPRGLTYNTYLGQYIIVGEGVVGSQCGAYYSLSHDLITWSTPYFLKPGKVGYGPCTGILGLTPYPTLVDHGSAGENFEYSGKDVFIYHSLWNSATTTDVDLIRAPVSFDAP